MVRLGSPQCCIAAELPTSMRWGLVAVDRDANLWAVDASLRGVYRFDKDYVRHLTTASSSPTSTVATASPSAVLEISTDDTVLYVGHADSDSHHSWVVTRKGAVYLFDKERIVCHHRVGSLLSAAVVRSPQTLIVALETDVADVSEVVEMVYDVGPQQQGHDAPVRTRAKALFRLRDHVRALCLFSQYATPTGIGGADDSVLVPDTASASARSLLLTVTERGNIDVWDLGSSFDATDEYGALQYDANALGSPTSAIVVQETLWIGTAFGPIVCADICRSECTVLSHHKAAVRSLLPMTMGRRVWSCCEDGVVAVWSVARKTPCGIFDLQATPITLLASAPRQVMTTVWGVDQHHHARCWEVREEFSDSAFARGGRESSGNPGRGCSPEQNISAEAETFVASLCAVLTGKRQSCAVPSRLESALPESRYLGDALVSLSECRAMICSAFGELGWESTSLSEDVRTLTRNARSQARAYARSSEVAERLCELTPAFPLPENITDGVDRLLMAAECVLEEIADQGILRHPHHLDNSRPDPSSPSRRRHEAKQSLDDSLCPPPEAQHLSAHIFETQLKALQDQLETERRQAAVWKERVKLLEHECERHERDATDAMEERSTQAAEVERLKKALHASKKKMNVVEEQLGKEKSSLSQALDACSAELATAKKELAELRRSRQDSGPTHEQSAIVNELFSLLKAIAKEHRQLRDAAASAARDFASAMDSFRAMEQEGRRVVHRMDADRLAAVDVVKSVQQHLQTQCNGRAGGVVDAANILARLAPLEALLKSRGDSAAHHAADVGRAPMRLVL